MKKNKFFLSIINIALVSTTIGTISLTTMNDQSIAKNTYNSTLYAWGNGGNGSAETQATFEFKNADELKNLNFSPKYPNDITNEDIQSFLKIKSGSASSWYAQKLDVTEEDKKQGKVRFHLFQNIRKSDGTYETKQIQNSNNSNEWDTSSSQDVSKLIISNKYKFAWASDEDFKNFFETTSFNSNDLSNDMVLKNFISSDSNLPENGVNIAYDDLNNSGTNYGVKKVTINFNSNKNNNDWEEGKPPGTQERVIRGLKHNGNLYEMSPKFNNNISDWEFEDDKLYGDVFGQLEKKVKNLTPSQFVAPIDYNDPIKQQKLMDLLIKGTGFKNNNKLVEIEYLGKKTTDSDFQNSTGLDPSQHTITKIRTIPNDLLGSLDIIYTLKVIDIYTNKLVEKDFKQSLPAGTFRTSNDANKVLFFEWKEDDALMPIGSSLDFVTNYNKNKNNDDYLRILTNQFFIGSEDVYDKARKVEINYHDDTATEGTDGYWNSSNNEKNVEITLTFPEWFGSAYIDESGVIHEGYKTKRVFNLKEYDNENRVTWKSQNEFISQNPSIPFTVPSELIGKIRENSGEFNTNMLYKLPNSVDESNVDVTLLSDDKNGSINVIIGFYEKENNENKLKSFSSHIYVGMKKNDTESEFLEYSWIPQNSISSNLLSIPIEQVTKKDVIDYYLNEIPMFKNKILSDNDVEIEIISGIQNNHKLKISVIIRTYNQSVPGINVKDKTFVTTISGFTTNNFQSSIKHNPPKDITALLAIPIATIVTSIMLVILISLISKRSKLRKFK